MKTAKRTTTFTLSPESIDIVSDQVQEFLTQIGTERKNIIRLKLSIENILLRLKDHFGEEKQFTFSTGSKLHRPYINIDVPGEQFDPTESDDEFGEISSHLFMGLGLYPGYAYSRNTNTVSFKLKKRQSNPIKGLLTAVILACIISFLGFLAPDGVRSACYDSLLTPVYDVFIGILNTVASPMIFLSVAWGIYGIGDAATLGRIGKRMLIRYVAMTGLITVFSLAVLLPFSKLHFASTGMDSSGINKIIELMLGIFPKNIVSPFLEGNTMQIILIASVVGCIMLILGSQTKLIATFIEQINYIIQYLIEMISSFVPVFIFIIILRLVWSDSLSDIYSVWKPFVSYLAVSFAAVLLVLAYVCIKEKTGLTNLIKKLFPSFFIALTTASSSAAFGTTVSSCEYDLGISSKITNFGVPLGMVLYKPTTAVSFIVSSLFFSAQYNVDISITWIITAVIVVTILAIALPPIPGGALACYTILFMQLGIPTEALGVVMILDIFADFTSTGFDTALRQCELVLTADNISMLDKAKLRKKKDLSKV